MILVSVADIKPGMCVALDQANRGEVKGCIQTASGRYVLLVKQVSVDLPASALVELLPSIRTG